MRLFYVIKDKMRDSLENTVKDSKTWIGKVFLMGVIGWNIVLGAATPVFMRNKGMSFREVDKSHYITLVEKPAWYEKPLGVVMHYTTYPGRIIGYFINRE